MNIKPLSLTLILGWAPNTMTVTNIMITGNNKPFESNICAVTTVDTWNSGRAQRLSLQGRVSHKTRLWICRPITSPDKGWWGPRARELSSEQRKSENEYYQDSLLEPLPIVLHLASTSPTGSLAVRLHVGWALPLWEEECWLTATCAVCRTNLGFPLSFQMPKPLAYPAWGDHSQMSALGGAPTSVK